MPTRIRSLRATDIDGLTTAILADDWGDRRSWLGFVDSHDACRALVATDDDDVAFGTAVATMNGRVGWIGTIWVAPDRRRSGVGRALTEAVIGAAEDAGATTLILVATAAGRPLYERLGFEVQTSYVTVEARGLAAGARTADPRIRTFRPDDLAAMAVLDTTATGEDRRHLLAAFATPADTRILETQDGELRGFVVRAPWGGGATIAPDPTDALTLLGARRIAAGPMRRVRAGVVLDNGAGMARLVGAGWVEAWRAPRLIRGAALSWRPESIWGQFNHALG